MNRRALVTGAGARIGCEIAAELARHGHDIAVHYRTSRDGAERVAAACRAEGVDAWTVQADLSTREGCASLVSAVQAKWDRLDVLVNNASIFSPRAFDAISWDDWQSMWMVNTTAPFLLSQGLLPQLRKGRAAHAAADGEGGTIVHLVDIGADRPVAGYAHYSTSKAALLMLVKAMAIELAPSVRVVGVSPGQVLWPEDYDDAKRARLAQRIPMKRVGTPLDIAKTVRFLATEAAYINGAVVPVDGGLHCRY